MTPIPGVEPPLRLTRQMIAKVITEVSAPAVCVVASLIVVGIQSSHRGAGAAWAGVAALLCTGVPMAYVIKGARDGKWSDHHVAERERRAIPLIVALVSVSVAAALLVLVRAPRELIALIVAMLAGLLAVIAITRFWKVSIHTAVVAGFLGILLDLYGPWALAGLVVLAAVAWSRVTLHAHTWAQALAGAVVGFAAATAVFPALL